MPRAVYHRICITGVCLNRVAEQYDLLCRQCQTDRDYRYEMSTNSERRAQQQREEIQEEIYDVDFGE